MNTRKCKDCYFGEQCPYSHPCDYFTPLEDNPHESLDKLVESERPAFNDAWRLYIAEYED